MIKKDLSEEERLSRRPPPVDCFVEVDCDKIHIEKEGKYRKPKVKRMTLIKEVAPNFRETSPANCANCDYSHYTLDEDKLLTCGLYNFTIKYPAKGHVCDRWMGDEEHTITR